MRHIPGSKRFFLTTATPCPYLPGRSERRIFTYLSGHEARELGDLLAHNGFRRSQNVVYRPECLACSACISVRVDVKRFIWSRSLARQWRRGRSICGKIVPAIATPEQYALFERYLGARHRDSDMNAMGFSDYRYMVEDTPVDSFMTEYREMQGTGPGARPAPLRAAAIGDFLSDGISMVYSFFDPACARQGLGTHMILDHVERARALKLPFVYLGYWVKGAPGMAYKTRFLPQQHLRAGQWQDWPPAGQA